MMTKISNDCQQTSVGELVPVFMNEMQHSIHEIVSDWANALTISREEAETVAMFTTGTIFGAILLWIQQPEDKQTVEDLADQMMPLLLDGIGSTSKMLIENEDFAKGPTKRGSIGM